MGPWSDSQRAQLNAHADAPSLSDLYAERMAQAIYVECATHVFKIACDPATAPVGDAETRLRMVREYARIAAATYFEKATT